MGQAVTALKRRALKPLQNFAVEARAERVISRDKPTPAPWHPTTVQKIAELSKGSHIPRIEEGAPLALASSFCFCPVKVRSVLV